MKVLLFSALLMLIGGSMKASCTFDSNVFRNPMLFSTWIEDTTNRLRQLGTASRDQNGLRTTPFKAVAPHPANQNIRIHEPPGWLDNLSNSKQIWVSPENSTSRTGSRFNRSLVEETGGCFAEDTGIQGRDFQVIQDCPSAMACQQHCYANVHCEHFSYSTTLGRCFLYDVGTGIRNSLGLISGPKVCPPVVEAATPVGTGQVSPSANSSGSEVVPNAGPMFCFVSDIRLEGSRLRIVNDISDAEACQRVCTYIENCAYFNYENQSNGCELLSDAHNVVGGVGLISGPVSCESGTGSEEPAVLSASQLGSPSGLDEASKQVVPEAYNPLLNYEPQGSTGQGLSASNIDPTVNSGGFLGELLSRGLNTGSGLLGGLLGRNSGEKLLEGQQIESLAAGAGQAFGVLTNIMAAGDTVMKTLPIADMVRAGAKVAQGRNMNRNSGSSPPVGVGRPEVTCLTEGMRCCVPRAAAPKYQSDPPKLNGVNSPRCSANYVSAWDQLCATIRFDDDECNTAIFETAELVVYRTRMEMPGNMNDAFCECSVQKSTDGLEAGDQQRISGSSNWEYSLAMQEEQTQTRERLQESMGSLSTAAKAALTWGDVLLGNPGASAVTATGGKGSAMGLLDTIIKLGEEITPGTTEGSVTTKDVSPGSGALLNILADLQNANQARQQGQRRLSVLQNPSVSADKTATTTPISLRASADRKPQLDLRSVPMNCAYWVVSSCENAADDKEDMRSRLQESKGDGDNVIHKVEQQSASGCMHDEGSFPKIFVKNECPSGSASAIVKYAVPPAVASGTAMPEEQTEAAAEILSIRLEDVPSNSSVLGVVCTYRLASAPERFASCESLEGDVVLPAKQSVRGQGDEARFTRSEPASQLRKEAVVGADQSHPATISPTTTKTVSFSIELPTFPHALTEQFQNKQLQQYSTVYQIDLPANDPLRVERLLGSAANEGEFREPVKVRELAVVPL